MPSSDGTAAQKDRAHINKDWVLDRRSIEDVKTRGVGIVTANGRGPRSRYAAAKHALRVPDGRWLWKAHSGSDSSARSRTVTTCARWT
jgi:hypothetical protein